MLKNIRDGLYRKPQIEKLRHDFEGDTMTAISITTMDDATHELTEDLIPSGFSTLKYPKGTQIKEIPKESSLRHFQFPDGKTGWVDELCVRNVVTEKVTTPEQSDASDSDILPQMEAFFGGELTTQIPDICHGILHLPEPWTRRSDTNDDAPKRQALCGFLRYDPPAEIAGGLRSEFVDTTVDIYDKHLWNIISDHKVKPISECSTIMELFGMKKGDKLYPGAPSVFVYTLNDISFKDGKFICHVTDIFCHDSERDVTEFYIHVSQDVLDRAIELTKESNEG